MENKPSRTTDERIDAIARNLELLSQTVEENTGKTNERFDKLLTATENLLAISESHQRRLDTLESR